MECDICQWLSRASRTARSRSSSLTSSPLSWNPCLSNTIAVKYPSYKLTRCDEFALTIMGPCSSGRLFPKEKNFILGSSNEVGRRLLVNLYSISPITNGEPTLCYDSTRNVGRRKFEVVLQNLNNERTSSSSR